MALSYSFIQKVAQLIGADPAFLGPVLEHWARGEGMPDWTFNPLATTQKWSDLNLDTNYDIGYGPGKWNDANGGMGVSVYADEDSGAKATARMIMNGNFPTLLSELQAGKLTAASAPDVRKWGTTAFANELDGGAGGGEPSVEENQYWQKRKQLDAIVQQYGLSYDQNGYLARDPLTGGASLLQDPAFKTSAPLSLDIIRQAVGLENEITNFEDQYGLSAAGGQAYDRYNATDPGIIGAQNAASRYSREYQNRVQAANMAAQAFNDQLQQVDAAQKSQFGWLPDSKGVMQPGSNVLVAPPAKIKSGDELFNEALARIKSGLPEVPDMPVPLRPANPRPPQTMPGAGTHAAALDTHGPGGAFGPMVENGAVSSNLPSGTAPQPINPSIFSNSMYTIRQGMPATAPGFRIRTSTLRDKLNAAKMPPLKLTPPIPTDPFKRTPGVIGNSDPFKRIPYVY